MIDFASLICAITDLAGGLLDLAVIGLRPAEEVAQ